MANTLKPKRSNTSSNTPSLQEGEIAINVADKKLWIGDNSPTPTPVLIVDGNADCFAIVTSDITNWNTAYGWGNHASAGYLTSETDPVFVASTAYGITTTDTGNWNSAYSERRQWDGGSTNLVAATGRTSLGGTTVGSNLFTLTNPSAVTFLKVNANNTVTAESASTFRTSIGAGTGNGTITSIATTSPITGGTITSTGTIGINASSTNTASYVVQRDASGNFSAGTITASLTGTASTATNVAGGGAGQIHYQSASNTTAMLAAGNAGQILRCGGNAAPTWANQGIFTGGRLTLQSNIPASPYNISGATTIYYAPYIGDRISLTDGISWTTHTFTQLSLALGTLTADLNYDIFIFNNAGTLTLESLAWTSDANRTTPVELFQGVWLKQGDKTKRYLGTFRTTSTTTTEDSETKRFLYNAHNLFTKPMFKKDTTASWTYGTASWRYANNSSANRLDFVQGIAQEAIFCHVLASASHSGTSNTYAGIGYDSNTANSGTAINKASTGSGALCGFYQTLPFAGFHYLAWIEYTAGATATFTGGSESGIYAQVRC